MAISFVDSASSLTTAVTTPTHVALDEMISVAVAASTSTPANPAGGTNVWVSRDTSVVTPAHRVSDKLASGTSDTSDPLTGATNAAAISETIYRGASGIGAIAVNNGTGTQVTLPAVTRTVTNGSSWILYVAVHLSAAGWTTVALPASIGGATPARRSSQAAYAVFDSNGPVSSNPTAQTFGGTFGSNTWRAIGIEILATPTSVTLTPAAASLTLTGSAPAIAVGTVLRPSAASLTLTGSAPGVGISVVTTISPTPAALTLTGSAPSLGLTVTPTAGLPDVLPDTLTEHTTLVLLGHAPTLMFSTVLRPAAASLTLTGSAPAVTATGHVWLAPAAAALTLTGSPPVIGMSYTASPASAILTLTGSPPALRTPLVVTPTQATLTLTGSDPTLRSGSGVTPITATLTLTGSAPAVSTTQNVWVIPQAAALSLTGFAPAVTATANVLLTPGGLVLVLSGGGAIVRSTTPTPPDCIWFVEPDGKWSVSESPSSFSVEREGLYQVV